MCETSPKYQKLLAENRKLQLEIKILTTSGFSMEKILLISKYRDNLKDECALDDLTRYFNPN